MAHLSLASDPGGKLRHSYFTDLATEAQRSLTPQAKSYRELVAQWPPLSFGFSDPPLSSPPPGGTNDDSKSSNSNIVEDLKGKP